MKKIWWVVITCALLVLAGGAFVFKRKPTGELLPSLRPYIEKDRVIYYDPAEMLKSIPASLSGSIPKSMLQPQMVRMIRTKKLTYDQLNKLMHQDLTVKNQWHFSPWPPVGVSSATYANLPKMIVATQGTPATGTPLMMFASPGMSDHAISAMSTEMLNFDPSNPPKNENQPQSYFITEQKRLSEMDVALLKIQHLGKNPYVGQDEYMKATMEMMGVPDLPSPSSLGSSTVIAP